MTKDTPLKRKYPDLIIKTIFTYLMLKERYLTTNIQKILNLENEREVTNTSEQKV